MKSRTVLLVPLLAVLGLLLAGCKGSVTADMAADAPADKQVTGVRVDIAGLEFKRSDETTEKLEFATTESADLMQLVELQDSLRLFTAETLPEGSYVGVRLLLADDQQNASVSRLDGTQFDLNLAEGDYTAIDFTVEKDKSSSASLSLTLDLRKSLAFSADDSNYTLTPVLRSAVTDEAAQVSGLVSATCPVGTSLAQGGAVYLFKGQDVDPNDLGSAAEPFATSAVTTTSLNDQFSYGLRFLPPGDYTIALTCNGDTDELGSDDDIAFVATTNIQLSSAETATHNFE
ncbi:MAG: DUF4382 domain-containing protein [Povalibacter sp.]